MKHRHKWKGDWRLGEMMTHGKWVQCWYRKCTGATISLSDGEIYPCEGYQYRRTKPQGGTK